MPSSPVGLTSMPDTHNEHDERVVQHFVHHAVVADAHPPQAAEISLQGASRQRLLRESVDREGNASPVRLRNSLQLPGCASLDPDRVVHA